MAEPAGIQAGRTGRPAAALAGAIALSVAALCAVGDPGQTLAVLASVVDSWLGYAAAAVYLLAAAGLGAVVRPMIRGARHAGAIQVGVGVAIMLTVSHGLGVLGVLNPTSAIGVCAIGIGVLGVQLARSSGEVARAFGTPWLALVCAVPIGVIAVASAAPPGWLWESEFGQYDSLAYHLHLPQEWLRAGRVWPVDHNVYSYLPSYIESAYVHLAHLTLAPIDGAGGHGLTAGDAWRAQATHWLSALLTLGTAWMIGAVVDTMLARSGASEARRRIGAWVAAGMTLATPWVVVVGTISYNEAGVTILGAAALLVAVQENIRPVWRGVLAGALVGVACGCKPTALVFVTPVVGIALLAYERPRAWAPMVIGACVAGLIALSPWLARNWVASGNPVFPQLTGVFGAGHWSAEQAERYAGAHTFDGGVLERARLMVWTDPGVPAEAPLVQRFRGAANPQWGLVFPIALALGLIACAARDGRRAALVLLGGLATQILAWGTLTHLQSRFLLPCVIAACPMIGVALGVGSWSRNERTRVVIGVLIVALQTAALIALFARDRGGRPNAKTPVGLAWDLARPFQPEIGADAPWVAINGQLDDDATVYLLGDAAAFIYERPVVSNSTYDAWPLGDAIRQNPGDPRAWTAFLRARGIDHVLISNAELGRLMRSGWIDPAITPERIEAWTRTLGQPMQVWERTGQALYALPEDG